MKQVAEAATAAEAFAIARANSALVVSNWDIQKKRTMFRGLMYKFKQHKELRDKLVATGDAVLIENSPVDSFWGCGADGKGQNFLGQMVSLFFRTLVFLVDGY
jgi:ribA/ribD-fused uncharacterized protein